MRIYRGVANWLLYVTFPITIWPFPISIVFHLNLGEGKCEVLGVLRGNGESLVAVSGGSLMLLIILLVSLKLLLLYLCEMLGFSCLLLCASSHFAPLV